MALANISNQILRSDGGSATVAANSPLTGNGSQQLPLGLDENYHGADGESLTFDITDIDNGHQVTISGSQGSSSFNVLDGTDGTNGINGADGQSVTFDITDIDNGHKVTLSGAQGSASFDVMNGTDCTGSYDDIFTYRLSTPATSVTVHSGLALHNYQQQGSVYQRFYVSGSPIGDIVPTAHSANQYLTTNSQGTLQWENKQESITDCTVMMDNASMSSVDLSSYTAYKQVTFVTPHLNTLEGGTSSYDLYINGTKKLALASACYFSFVQQKLYNTTSWMGASSGYTRWID